LLIGFAELELARRIIPEIQKQNTSRKSVNGNSLRTDLDVLAWHSPASALGEFVLV
jgi:hypothetical protein